MNITPTADPAQALMGAHTAAANPALALMITPTAANPALARPHLCQLRSTLPPAALTSSPPHSSHKPHNPATIPLLTPSHCHNTTPPTATAKAPQTRYSCLNTLMLTALVKAVKTFLSYHNTLMLAALVNSLKYPP